MPKLEELSWQERATAAEKTVDVLEDKVSALYNGAQTVVQRQLEKVRSREERNRRRREVSEARTAELQRHSARLEAEVFERTHQIRAILDNVTFGFLLIDRNLDVLEGHTGSCVELLSTETIAGRSIGDVLGLNERAFGNYAAGIDQLFEDLLPEDVLVDQVVTRFELDDRVLRVDPRIVRDDEGVPERILLSISDITPLEAAEREARTNAVLVELLRSKDAFTNFLADVRCSLDLARDHLDDANYVRRIVHTVKGNAATYGLDEIVSFTHAVEEREVLGVSEIDAIEGLFREFLVRHESILEVDYDAVGNSVFEVSRRSLEELRTIAAASTDHDLRRWTASVALKPVGLLLGPIGSFVEKLAQRLDKIVDFEVAGLDTLVDPELVSPVLRTLTHLIRNAVDHGIEDEFERGGKPPRATISLTVGEEDRSWFVEVRDDGRGIDTAALVANAVASGKLSPAQVQGLGQQERIRLLFLDGVSSRSNVTEISGRGVGTSAVLTEVRRAGGRVDIDTRPGLGTTFHLVIPKPEALAAAKRSVA